MMSGILSNAMGYQFNDGLYSTTNFWDEVVPGNGSPLGSELSDADQMDHMTSTEWGSPVSNNFSDQENFPFGHEMLGSDFLVGKDELTTKAKKLPRGPGRKIHQRSAANQRERRRMKTINEAFEQLRDRIPVSSLTASAACGSDRKLSKVDTLKQAIRYIQHLSEVLSACEDPMRISSKGKPDAKVILRCQTSGFTDCMQVAAKFPIYGHSLSWTSDSAPKVSKDNKMVAKLWVPDVATVVDMEGCPLDSQCL